MISFTIFGQIRGGKNHVNITRTGHRYPNAMFAKWRNETIAQVRNQWPTISIADRKEVRPVCLTVPCRVTVRYWSGDKRRRDVPAMIDAIWHVLERGGFVADDALLESVNWSHEGYDKQNPQTMIKIEPL